MIPSLTPAAAPDWFPRADLMTIGAYYYPEAWPESQWARDMANMHKAINDQLQKMQNLDLKPDQRFINCSACHRGAINPNG